MNFLVRSNIIVSKGGVGIPSTGVSYFVVLQTLKLLMTNIKEMVHPVPGTEKEKLNLKLKPKVNLLCL
jgi:hypothetical protein